MTVLVGCPTAVNVNPVSTERYHTPKELCSIFALNARRMGDLMKHVCEEIRVFEGMAERTGEQLELGGLKAHTNGCTSMRDLVRKYRIFGDGHFYLALGNWPAGQPVVSLDNVKWIGLDRTFQGRKRFAPSPPAEEDNA